MNASLLFWPILCLPGYAILRRLDREDAESGLLGVVAVSFLASLTFLSPLSILCYVTGVPVAAFSAAIVVLVLGSVVDLTRQKAWRDVGRVLLSAACIEFVIVLADLVIGLRIGSFLGGDAKVHLARIRFLMDHGFSNLDPNMSEPFFYPLYHTNIIHALYAACVKLFNGGPFGVWFTSLVWGKLLCTSGAYYLAWRILGSQWAGWIAALFTLAMRGPITYAIYPNQLAPFWLLPLMIGFAAQSMRRDGSMIPAFKIAAASLVMGQMHGLYVVFAVITLAPLVVGRWTLAVIQKEQRNLRHIVAAAALLVGIPFVVVTRATTRLPPPSDEEVVLAEVPQGFFVHADGSITREPEAVLEQLGGVPGLMILGAALVIGLASKRRVELAALLVPMGVAATALLISPICAFLIEKAGEAWVVERLDAFLVIGYCTIVAVALAYQLEPLLKRRVLRSLVALVALPAGAYFANLEAPLTWPKTLEAARKSPEERHGYMNRMRMLRDFLALHVPPGSTILADPLEGMDLVQLYDCHIVASISASNGVPDMPDRFEDLQRMIADDTPWDIRRELLLKHGVSYFFPINCPIEWTVGHVAEYWLLRPWVISRLDVSK